MPPSLIRVAAPATQTAHQLTAGTNFAPEYFANADAHAPPQDANPAAPSTRRFYRVRESVPHRARNVRATSFARRAILRTPKRTDRRYESPAKSALQSPPAAREKYRQSQPARPCTLRSRSATPEIDAPPPYRRHVPAQPRSHRRVQQASRVCA